MIDFNRLRRPNMGGGGTGYNIYDTFMDKVLPGIRGARDRNRQYSEGLTQGERQYESGEKELDRNFQLTRDRQNALNEIATMQAKQSMQPMNVVMDRSQEITPRMREDFRLREKEIDRKSEWDTVREELETGKAKTAAAQRDRSLDIQEWKARNPNKKIEARPGGDLVAIDPITGQAEAVLDKDGKRIASGTMTQAEVLAFQRDAAIEKAAEGAKVAAKAEEGKQTNREELAADRAWQTVNVTAKDGSTKTIRYNPITNKVEDLPLPADTTGQITKPGTKPAENAVAAKDEKLEGIRAKAQEALNTIDELLDPKTDKLKESAQSNIGWSRMIPLRLGPTEARQTENTINRLKAEQVLSVIGEMKAQSRTGATGFGALNMKELSVLENAASQLDPGMREEDFEKELIRIKTRLQMIMQDAPTSGGPGPGPGAAPDARTRAAELIKKHSGG